jgi:hypothetical protein
MKKFLLKSLSVFLAITLLASQSFSAYAGNAASVVTFDESVFSFDEELLFAELEELNELNAFVETNEGITYSELENESSLLLTNIENSAAPMGMAEGGEPPLGIPSFLWGCVFGVVGLVIVYIMTENDMDETKKALWGCVASTAVGVVLYMVVWGAWAAVATTTYTY